MLMTCLVQYPSTGYLKKNIIVKVHSHFLCLMKCFSELLQNFPYFYVWTLEYETPSIFFHFSFFASLLSPKFQK